MNIGSSNKKKKKNTTESTTFSYCYTENDLLKIKYELSNNCSCKTKQADGGCYMRCFGNSNNAIIECRNVLALLEGDQLAFRTTEVLRGILPDDVSKTKLSYEYKIKGQRVCKNTFLDLYSISDFSWKKFCKQVKEKGNSSVNPAPVRTWNDSYIHELSHNEVREFYEENLMESSGNFTY
jgi:hypothetical protein